MLSVKTFRKGTERTIRLLQREGDGKGGGKEGGKEGVKKRKITGYKAEGGGDGKNNRYVRENNLPTAHLEAPSGNKSPPHSRRRPARPNSRCYAYEVDGVVCSKPRESLLSPLRELLSPRRLDPRPVSGEERDTNRGTGRDGAWRNGTGRNRTRGKATLSHPTPRYTTPSFFRPPHATQPHATPPHATPRQVRSGLEGTASERPTEHL